MMWNLPRITSHNLQLSKVNSTGFQSLQADPESKLPDAPAVTRYLSAATADNTRKAYRADLVDFLAWGGSIPATAEEVAQYLADRADTLAVVTLSRRLVAIGRAHTSQGHPDPTKTDLTRAVLKGIRRTKGMAQRQVSPVLASDLLAMTEHMQGIKGLRDRALLALGFAAALRRSELVALDVADLSFVSEGLVITLRRSKTDQAGEGRKIGVPWGRTAACPVRAVRAWLDHTQAQDGPLFLNVKKGGALGTRLSDHAVAEIVKTYAQAIGLDPACLSGHSLRSGLVTSAAKAGIALHRIADQTGHRSMEMLRRYIRDANLFLNNAGAIL